jgi:hypothetical protein
MLRKHLPQRLIQNRRDQRRIDLEESGQPSCRVGLISRGIDQMNHLVAVRERTPHHTIYLRPR